MCIYLFIFGATWGPIPWLLGAEVFPLRARAKGMALSTSVNWLSNFIIAFITPPLFSVLGGGYYFLLLGFTAVSGVVVYLIYPETAGKTLEELGAVFGDAAVVVDVGGADQVGRMGMMSDGSLEKGREEQRLEVAGHRGIVSEPGMMQAAESLGLRDVHLSDEETSMSDVALDNEDEGADRSHRHEEDEGVLGSEETLAHEERGKDGKGEHRGVHRGQ